MTQPANSTDPIAPAWRSRTPEAPHELDPDRIQPWRGRLLVLPEKTPERIGLIHVPDNARSKQMRGTVLAVGLGKFIDGVEIPIDIDVGATVLFNGYGGKYGGTTVKLRGGDEAVILEEDDIVAVYNPELP